MNILSPLNKLYLREGILRVRYEHQRKAKKSTAVTVYKLTQVKTKILKLEQRRAA